MVLSSKRVIASSEFKKIYFKSPHQREAEELYEITR